MRTRTLDRPTLPGRSGGLFARAKRRDDQRLAGMLARDTDAVLVLRGPVVSSASDGTRTLLGWEPSLCVGRTLSELVESPVPAEARTIIDQLQDAAEAAGGHLATHRDLALTHIDGQTIWVDATIADLRHDANVGGTILTLHDVSERHALEDRLRQAEFRDDLTGLANRRMLRLLVDDAVRVPQQLGVMLIDLDGFGAINDRLGSDVGDQVLVEVATRLAATLRAGDHIARIDGDEFALVVNGLDPDEPKRDAAEVVERVERALEAPVVIDGVSLQITASIGTAVHDTATGTVSTDELLAAASDRVRLLRRGGHPSQQPG